MPVGNFYPSFNVDQSHYVGFDINREELLLLYLGCDHLKFICVYVIFAQLFSISTEALELLALGSGFCA